MVLCTGYRTSLECQGGLSRDAVRARAFFVGLGPEQRDLLPLQGIGREARKVAAQVSDMLRIEDAPKSTGLGHSGVLAGTNEGQGPVSHVPSQTTEGRLTVFLDSRICFIETFETCAQLGG